jgi:hypothetical protein
MTRKIAIALGLLLATSSVAAEKSTPKPEPLAAAADEAVCTDETAAHAEKARRRDAALAELGRRLDAEPKVEGEFRVLYPNGHNYDQSTTAQSPAPPAKPAPVPKPR